MSDTGDVVAVLQQLLSEINKRILPGELPGNGFDKMAERNGLILAANIIQERLRSVQQSIDS